MKNKQKISEHKDFMAAVDALFAWLDDQDIPPSKGEGLLTFVLAGVISASSDDWPTLNKHIAGVQSALAGMTTELFIDKQSEGATP